jgi:hypothetical protein
MKKLLMSTAIIGSFAAAPAFSDPTLMVGLTWGFGSGAQNGQLGISARVLSDDQRDEWVGAIGGTYYPSSGEFGFDVGVGYTFTNTPIMWSYDLINNRMQLGLGWADLNDEIVPDETVPEDIELY